MSKDEFTGLVHLKNMRDIGKFADTQWQVFRGLIAAHDWVDIELRRNIQINKHVYNVKDILTTPFTLGKAAMGFVIVGDPVY